MFSAAQYYKDNKESLREYNTTWYRFKLYGITKEKYKEMYQKQNGKCLICFRTKDVLCVDHNHSTGKIRGLLCKPCNSLLGHLEADITKIERIQLYLSK